MTTNRHFLLAATTFDPTLSPQGSQGVLTSRQDHPTSPYRVFRAGTAALLLVIGGVHLHLWFAGYRHLPTIGPLFLVAVVSAALLAVVASVRINAVIAAAAASFAAGTLIANILSLLLPAGLFGFKEVGVSYSGGFAIASEIGVVALLSIWALMRFRQLESSSVRHHPAQRRTLSHPSQISGQPGLRRSRNPIDRETMKGRIR